MKGNGKYLRQRPSPSYAGDGNVPAEVQKHYFNYPGSPKSNCYVERFNRTIQEQYVNWNKEDLYEPEVFNYGLMDYLLWYNTEKPHRGLPDKQPPLRYLLASAGLELQQSNMLWTSTRG
ncbi:MAG: integrase core domain-containing protein [bacterium]|nr:integrase core domain-containing protein [bacterium]